ncbi:Ger(x)C family spore germination protein [Neobacillus mesonae]|uniref:Ger(x)C family spore germination protein n=1 Tax=Neobacillus mesonae TaxID=1193713 RepID=UPI000A05C6DF|nr:Ger(x)C family spore germination protein [Neobacillus mesonae]
MIKVRTRIIILLPVFFTSFILSGCWDTNEPERMVYVQGVGIDFKDQKYTVYAQIVNTSTTAKTEAMGGPSPTKLVVGHASGKTLNQAMFNLYSSSQRRLFWGHLSFIVLTEKALKQKNIQAVIDQFDRYRETRYSIHFYVTRDPLTEVLRSLPPLEMSTYLSRLGDPEAAYEQRSVIRPLNLRELLIALNEPPHEAVIPYIRLTKGTWETETKPVRIIEFSGAALLTKNELLESIPLNQFKGLRWTNNDLKREEITLTNNLSPISLVVTKLKIKKKPLIHAKTIRFQITVDVTTTLSEIKKPEQLPKIKQEAEKLLSAEIKDTYLRGLQHNTDILRLSEVVYRKNLKTWKEVERNGKVPLTADSLQKITVIVKIIHGEKQKMKPTL